MLLLRQRDRQTPYNRIQIIQKNNKLHVNNITYCCIICRQNTAITPRNRVCEGNQKIKSLSKCPQNPYGSPFIPSSSPSFPFFGAMLFKRDWVERTNTMPTIHIYIHNHLLKHERKNVLRLGSAS